MGAPLLVRLSILEYLKSKVIPNVKFPTGRIDCLFVEEHDDASTHRG